MNKRESKLIGDLQLVVTPEAEDAFYFLKDLEGLVDESDKAIMEEVCSLPDDYKDGDNPDFDKRWAEYERNSQAKVNAGKRLLEVPTEERRKAIHTAYKMIDNVKKYGVACYDWIPND